MPPDFWELRQRKRCFDFTHTLCSPTWVEQLKTELFKSPAQYSRMWVVLMELWNLHPSSTNHKSSSTIWHRISVSGYLCFWHPWPRKATHLQVVGPQIHSLGKKFYTIHLFNIIIYYTVQKNNISPWMKYDLKSQAKIDAWDKFLFLWDPCASLQRPLGNISQGWCRWQLSKKKSITT